jgi:hypothetical protein
MPRYSQRRIAALLRAVDEAPDSDAKGARLEDLVDYLFTKIRGVSFLERNVLDAPRAHELDSAYWNDQPESEVAFLDAVILVECKATQDPVGSAAVGWFVRKLQDRGAHHGILVALSGITGAGHQTSAESEVITALVRDKIKILLLERDEVSNIRNTQDLANLLKQKILALTLRRAVYREPAPTPAPGVVGPEPEQPV